MGYQAINYKNIPVQSEIISGIIGLDVDSISCFRDLDGFVRSDQGVATLLLRVVNSPIYSRGRKIATIPMAISVLGFNVVQFPQSDNAFDSHGEALLELRRPQEAKAQFLKAVALGKVNPQRSPKALRGFEDNLQKAEAAIKATP